MIADLAPTDRAATGTAPADRRPPEPVIETRGLTKRYGSHVAVDGLDLAILPQEIFGILGPNGAGKTTTLEMIEGLRAPDAGTVRVAGFDPMAQGDEVRRLIGVQLQTTALFDYLTAAELVELFAGLYDVDGSPARVAQLIGMVGLEEKRHSRVDELSGGQRQRLAVAIALVNDPRIVFLDEPTTGLDPAARRSLWQTIREIRAGGATVVLTTHYMEEAETLCDRVAIMEGGRIITCDPPAELIRKLGADATIRTTVVRGTVPAEAVRGLPGVLAVSEEPRDDGTALRIQTADAQGTLVGLLELATASDATLSGLAVNQASLEDVYLGITGRSYESGADEAAPNEEPKGRRRRR